MNWLPWMPTLLGIAAALLSWGSYLLSKRKSKADIAVLYENMSTRQAERLDRLERNMEWMKNAMAERDDFIMVLLSGIAQLVSQIKGLRRKPCWEPPVPNFRYQRDGTPVPEWKPESTNANAE